MEILVLEVDGCRIGLPAAAVRQVVRAMAVIPLPGAPAVIAGVVDVHGTLAPVLDLRARLGLTRAPVNVQEEWVLARAGERTVVLRADRVVELHEVEERQVEDVRGALPTQRRLTGAARLSDGLVLIHDPEAFLEHAEEEALDRALAEAGGAPEGGG